MRSFQFPLAASLSLLIACGCGGDAPSVATPTPPVTQLPTLQLSLGAPKAFVGDSVTLSWTTQQATSCLAAGAWNGTQNVQGNIRVAYQTGGVRSFVLTCSGPGGAVTDSTRLIVPLPVFPTSYENAKNIETPVTQMPLVTPPICDTNDARAYADFLQEGTLSRFVHGTVYDSVTPGTMCLQRRAPNGSWVDVTASYISDTRGCLHPREVIVADFNKDKKPDMFTACAGWDRAPFTGEKSILLLSNAQGRYDRFEMADVAYSHGAAAADVNGDGYPDILLLDSSHNSYWFYMNQGGTGAFVRDMTRLPLAYLKRTSYFSVQLTDVDGDGIVDVVMGGFDSNDANAAPATLLRGTAAGTFTAYPPVTWPAETGCLTNLDYAIRGGAAYLLRECNNYGGFAITKVSIATGQASLLYDAKSVGHAARWLFLAGGKFVYDDVSLPLSVVP